MPDPPRYILAPYVPTPPEVVDRMLDVAEVRATDRVYDLGCGDGRVVIAAARSRGARGMGIDIEPYWIEESCKNAAAAGVADLVRFEVQDAVLADVREATVVFLYLVEWSTQMIASSIIPQLADGARIVSLTFPFGNWPARATRFTDAAGRDRALHLWVKESAQGPVIG